MEQKTSPNITGASGKGNEMKRLSITIALCMAALNADPFLIRENDVVTDVLLKRQWQDDETVVNRTLGWAEAVAYCTALELNGDDDWRLPSQNELLSLVDYGAAYPSADTTMEHWPEALFFWSSTTAASDNTYGWGVGFEEGIAGVDAKTTAYHVRCVRSVTE